MGYAPEPAQVADLGDGLIRMGKEQSGAFQPRLKQVLIRCAAGIFFKYPAKVVGAHIHAGSYLRNCNLPGKIVPDKLQGTCYSLFMEAVCC